MTWFYCRGVGASTATPALAVVDFGPTYLVGLLRATYSRATSLLAIVLVSERDQCRGCGLRMRITNSLVLDTCMSSCSIEIHVQSNYMSIPVADTNVQD